MPFVNLEIASPKKQGVYKVVIKGRTGTREARASWSRQGFLPISDNLLIDESIISWWRD